MAATDPGGSGRVRVSVTSARRRVDLVLPGTLPVADLVPELARSVGLLDGDTVHGGYRLAVPGGRRLEPGAGLIGQGVEDGAILTLSAAADDSPPRVYDDVAEAMADAVETEVSPWRDGHSRATALVAGIVLVLLGAAALLAQGMSRQSGTVSGIVSGGVAVALLGGAIALARGERQAGTAVAVAWVACLYAAIGGLLVARHPGGMPGDLLGQPLAASGGAVLLAGAIGLAGVTTSGRSLLLPAVVDGAVLLVAGVVVQATGWRAAVVLSVLLTAVVSISGVFPRLILGGIGRRHSLDVEPVGIDVHRVAADARMAHALLTGISATVGVLLVLAVPFAVGLGLWGTLLALAACVAVMLRSRHYRAAGEVGAGLVLGALGAVIAGATALGLHPSWRPVATSALVVMGAIVLVWASCWRGRSLRQAWAADVAESAALALMFPLLVLASGLLPAVSL